MQKLERFFKVSQHNLFMFKTRTTVQKIIYIYIYIYIYFFFFFFFFFFFCSILDHFAKNFLEHLRLYFLDPSVQCFLLCYSPSIQITQFIQHMIRQHSCYTHQSHIKHHVCSVLILPRDCLGNHIPNPNIKLYQAVMFLYLNDSGLSPSPSSPRCIPKLYTHQAPRVIVYLSVDTKL